MELAIEEEDVEKEIAVPQVSLEQISNYALVIFDIETTGLRTTDEVVQVGQFLFRIT